MCKKLLTCFVNWNLGRGILHENLDANRVFIGLILRLFDTICVVSAFLCCETEALVFLITKAA